MSAARRANSVRWLRCVDFVAAVVVDEVDESVMWPLAAAFSVSVRRDWRWAERAFEVPVVEEEERAFLRCACARMERNSEVRSWIDVTAMM